MSDFNQKFKVYCKGVVKVDNCEVCRPSWDSYCNSITVWLLAFMMCMYVAAQYHLTVIRESLSWVVNLVCVDAGYLPPAYNWMDKVYECKTSLNVGISPFCFFSIFFSFQ